MNTHFVYKYVLNGEIIYIGITDRPLKQRLDEHGRTGDNINPEGWDDINRAQVFYFKVNGRNVADGLETCLIEKYRPKYNKAKKSSWSGIDFVEPEWTPIKRPYKRKRSHALNAAKTGAIIQDLFMAHLSPWEQYTGEWFTIDDVFWYIERNKESKDGFVAVFFDLGSVSVIDIYTDFNHSQDLSIVFERSFYDTGKLLTRNGDAFIRSKRRFIRFCDDCRYLSWKEAIRKKCKDRHMMFKRTVLKDGAE